MSDETRGTIEAFAIVAVALAPLAIMLSVLVWPPKSNAAIILARALACFAVVLYPAAGVYAFSHDTHDYRFKVAFIIMMADTAPLVFVAIRTAMSISRAGI